MSLVFNVCCLLCVEYIVHNTEPTTYLPPNKLFAHFNLLKAEERIRTMSDNDDYGRAQEEDKSSFVKIKAMNQFFPEAHAYKVPPSVLQAHYPFNTPPHRIPYDIYINRYLSMWIMPSNHITHALFFATIIFLVAQQLFPPAMELLALYYDGTFGHFGSLECFRHDCPDDVLQRVWRQFYVYLLVLLLVLGIAWKRVFRRFRGRPWMDNNFTEFNRLPMTTSCMRWMVDESCAREVACRPQLMATANATVTGGGAGTGTTGTGTDAGNKSGTGMDLVPNVWNMDKEDWKFQLRSTVERALQVVYHDRDEEDSFNGNGNPRAWWNKGKASVSKEVREWRPIAVPANWTMVEDIPDQPIYTNIRYPFPCVPPFVPDQNPTGVYKLMFDLPAKWQGESRSIGDDYMVTFHGVESAFFLFVNSEYVGYSQDSRLPASFDVTPHLEATGNIMHVVVCRWSDGSYLEDQDHWWMAGIHRSVELTRKGPDMDIGDFRVQGDMDGRLSICVDLKKSMRLHSQKKLSFRLFSDEQKDFLSNHGENNLEEGILVWSATKDIVNSKCEEEEFTGEVSEMIPNVELWSDEVPNLYTLVISVVNSADEKPYQIESCRVGFRSVDIQDGMLLVNGKPVTICGVNRHEHDPDHGKVVSVESMANDIEIAKRSNFNAIRTSHYPNDVPFYRLCDYYGILVCDEANVETHGMMPMGKLADDFSWAKSFVERVTRMVDRDRNHPSIILWSLGNECGRGRNLNMSREALKRLDTSRPICYEGGGGIFEGTGETELTDIICPMYSNVEKTIALAKKHRDRPVILCEYRYVFGY